MRTRLVKIIQHKFGFKDEIKKINFYRRAKKIRNQNNEDKIEKKIIL
jgi:hypothetical protein